MRRQRSAKSKHDNAGPSRSPTDEADWRLRNGSSLRRNKPPRTSTERVGPSANSRGRLTTHEGSGGENQLRANRNDPHQNRQNRTKRAKLPTRHLPSRHQQSLRSQGFVATAKKATKPPAGQIGNHNAIAKQEQRSNRSRK